MAQGYRQTCTGLALVESALALARTVPLATWFLYYLGSIPFCAALIWFWASMANRGDAIELLGWGSALLTALYGWMKGWQYCFCQALSAQLLEAPLPNVTLREWIRVSARQLFVHATGWFLLPLAFLLTVALPWALAAYQYASIVPDRAGQSPAQWRGEVIRHAQLWPRQNTVLLWILSPHLPIWFAMALIGFAPILEYFLPEPIYLMLFFFTLLIGLAIFLASLVAVVALAMICATFYFVVSLFDALSGASFFTLYSSSQLINTTTVAMAVGLLYLVLDPLLKAAYVIRYYEGESRATGADLRLKWKRSCQTLSLLLILFSVWGNTLFSTATAQEVTTPAGPASINPDALRQALDIELERPDYLWKENRVVPESTATLYVVQVAQDVLEFCLDSLRYVWDIVNDLWDWFFGADDPAAQPEGEAGGNPVLRTVIVALIVLVCLLLLYVIVTALRTWLRDGASRGMSLATAIGTETVDVADESTQADALPEDAWLSMAENLLREGSYRLAMRAFFLSILAQEAAAGRIAIKRSKTNLDYLQETRRRTAAPANGAGAFAQAIELFETAWYGTREAQADDAQIFRTVKEALQAHAR
ncbi:MAG: DUF4129 domain-containing protein [Candidatus Hydrogenedentes bacterium]|nr:DUF4129 domain-containing protein [Candidatus Hydrogenedentota bacterium]